jgi:hypothetical protein
MSASDYVGLAYLLFMLFAFSIVAAVCYLAKETI